MAKKKQLTPPVVAKKEKKGKGAKEEEKSAPPVKNGRAIVAQSSSWTGKLPSSLLHEHCQKQKWNKVDYDMKKLPEGFLAVPVLSWKNPKTSETIVVKYHPPKDIVKPQETALEARHYAATYALHRLAFHKNIHMVLPTNHKHLWSDLETERKKITKEHPQRAALEYTAEPFVAVLEKRKQDEATKKEREVKEAASKKEKKPTIVIGNPIKKKTTSVSQASTKTSNYNKTTVSNVHAVSFPRKIWDSTAMIDLDSELRANIESAIKNHIDWSEEHVSQISHDTSYSSKLEALGFRKTHIDEALRYTYTFNDTLEWLIFHLPEDDLPNAFAKNDKESGTKLTVMKDIKFERIVSKLTRGGFSKTDVRTALSGNENDLIKAAVYLTNKNVLEMSIDENLEQSYRSESLNEWLEEKESLKTIYESRVIDDDPPRDDVFEIKLNPEGLKKDLLSLMVYRSTCYPHDICGLFLIVKDDSYSLPNYIKVNIIQGLCSYILENSLLGMPYLYSCVDWLEENIMKVIQNPGPLYDPSKYKKRQQQLIESGKSTSVKGKSNGSRSKKLNSEGIKSDYEQRIESSDMKKSLNARAKLPAWQKQKDIVQMINSNKVCLITGETGSGKSTQIVQFILDDLNSKGDYTTTIVCTQPRRISAIGLADRVSSERVDTCGKETGYVIRGENKTGSMTRISFVTTGVLLRMIQSIFGSSHHDSFFDNLGYIFIDEVHERSIDSDFLLIILKQISHKFPKLRIVLMSATIDINIFHGYFKDNEKISHEHISGRTFPIKDYFLDDILRELDYTYVNNQDEVMKPTANSKFFSDGNINYDLVGKLVDYIDEQLSNEGNNGSILIFMPGVLEIKKTINALNDGKGNYWALPLHSTLSSPEQKKIFNTAPRGQRKVVISTNIAETSITIPDAVAVVDAGRVKVVQYDPRSNSTKLMECWASQAEVGQRRGRAGRVQEGNCYKLYTKETMANSMLPQAIPEIKRTKLESIYLVVKSMGVKDVHKFLQNGLDPPGKENIMNAKRVLGELGALHNDELTHLGEYLSMLPTDLNSGKMLIFGAIFGCLDACLTLAAINASGNPFIIKQEERDEVKRVQMKFSNGHGDLIAILNAFNEYSNLKGSAKWKFLQENYLSPLRMNDIESSRVQYLTNLKDIGIVPLDYHSKDEIFNRNIENYTIIKAILASASYPNIARIEYPDTKYLQTISGTVELDPDVKAIKYWIRNEESFKDPTQLPSKRAFIHPSSTLFDVNDATGNVNFVTYGTQQETSKLFLRDITPSSILSVLLFGGRISFDISGNSRGIIMDDWLPIRTWCKNGVLLIKLRLLLDETIKSKLENPGTQNGNDVLKIIEKLIRSNI